jgi:DNA-binding TFAR19-related protein (PDSD5 family)
LTEKEDQDEHELEKIRLKKMKALMDAQKMQQVAQERVASIYDKIDFVLRAVLEPKAYTYFNKLKNEEPAVYQRIYSELVSADVVQNIDYLIALIRQRGSVGRQIPLDLIIYLERKIKGIKGTIKVKQGDGEMMDLGSYLTK